VVIAALHRQWRAQRLDQQRRGRRRRRWLDRARPGRHRHRRAGQPGPVRGIDGDGRDDYLVLAANGAVTAWINHGGDRQISTDRQSRAPPSR